MRLHFLEESKKLEKIKVASKQQAAGRMSMLPGSIDTAIADQETAEKAAEDTERAELMQLLADARANGEEEFLPGQPRPSRGSGRGSGGRRGGRGRWGSLRAAVLMGGSRGGRGGRARGGQGM